MASTGRQPLVPQDVFFMDGNGPPNVGDAPTKSLTEHATELKRTWKQLGKKFERRATRPSRSSVPSLTPSGSRRSLHRER